MDRLFFFWLWPTVAFVAIFLNCWKWEHIRPLASFWIALGAALGVVGLGLAMVAL